VHTNHLIAQAMDLIEEDVGESVIVVTGDNNSSGDEQETETARESN